MSEAKIIMPVKDRAKKWAEKTTAEKTCEPQESWESGGN